MKYPYFFDQAKRKAEVGKNLDDDMPNLVQKIFDELYKGEFKDKLFLSEKCRRRTYFKLPIKKN